MNNLQLSDEEIHLLPPELRRRLTPGFDQAAFASQIVSGIVVAMAEMNIRQIVSQEVSDAVGRALRGVRVGAAGAEPAEILTGPVTAAHLTPEVLTGILQRLSAENISRLVAVVESGYGSTRDQILAVARTPFQWRWFGTAFTRAVRAATGISEASILEWRRGPTNEEDRLIIDPEILGLFAKALTAYTSKSVQVGEPRITVPRGAAATRPPVPGLEPLPKESAPASPAAAPAAQPKPEAAAKPPSVAKPTPPAPAAVKKEAGPKTPPPKATESAPAKSAPKSADAKPAPKSAVKPVPAPPPAPQSAGKGSLFGSPGEKRKSLFGLTPSPRLFGSTSTGTGTAMVLGTPRSAKEGATKSEGGDPKKGDAGEDGPGRAGPRDKGLTAARSVPAASGGVLGGAVRPRGTLQLIGSPIEAGDVSSAKATRAVKPPRQAELPGVTVASPTLARLPERPMPAAPAAPAEAAAPAAIESAPAVRAPRFEPGPPPLEPTQLPDGWMGAGAASPASASASAPPPPSRAETAFVDARDTSDVDSYLDLVTPRFY